VGPRAGGAARSGAVPVPGGRRCDLLSGGRGPIRAWVVYLLAARHLRGWCGRNAERGARFGRVSRMIGPAVCFVVLPRAGAAFWSRGTSSSLPATRREVALGLFSGRGISRERRLVSTSHARRICPCLRLGRSDIELLAVGVIFLLNIRHVLFFIIRHARIITEES